MKSMYLSLLALLAFASPALADDATPTFVPTGCAVEDWCLVKATDCFVGMVANPGGLYQGHAQYSVVRRATALCPEGYYGQMVRHTFTSPVEPVPFRSSVYSTEAPARAEALQLCQTYRADWVSAAPSCGGP